MDLSAIVGACLHRHDVENSVGIVAVSGGPDSVALAHLCAGLVRAGKIARLVLAHVNHQLRGAESDADETFVKDLLASWQLHNDPRLACRTTRIDVAAVADAEHANLESIARRERYHWFTEVAVEENASWVATGHSADDQAETVLFRLLRGSGVLGLGGMAEARLLGDSVTLLRPLLTVRRQMLLDYLHDAHIDYRIDSSNRDLHFARNRLRHELLPLLEKDHNPAVVEVLCRLAAQAQELHAEIAAKARRLLAVAELPRAGDMVVLSLERLADAGPNLLRETFRLVWQREGWPMGDMDFERWHRLVEIVAGTSPAWDFPGRIHVSCVGKVLQLQVAAAYN